MGQAKCARHGAQNGQKRRQRRRRERKGGIAACLLLHRLPFARNSALTLALTSLLHSAQRRCTYSSSVAPPRASRTGPSSGPRLTAAAGGCPHSAQ